MNKRKLLIVSLVSLILILALVGGWLIYRDTLIKRAGVTEPPVSDTDSEEVKVPDPVVTFPDEDEGANTIQTDDVVPDEVDEYVCPDKLKDAIEKNPDVYAWLEITDSDISYPICNKEGNNSYYLNHSSSGAWNPMGAIFTEDYNSRDFTDTAVLVYGHSMTGKQFFGTLQKDYSSKDFFDSHREIKVYLEDRELTYRIFAAVTFSDVHILYYYDFSEPFFYKAFVNSVAYQRTLNSIVDKEAIPEYDTGLIVLSTCLKGANDKRFLVVGALTDSD